MSGVLILSVSAGRLAAPADEVGQQVAQALLAHGLPVASRQVVDEAEPAVEAALRSGVGTYGLIVILGSGGGSGGEIVRRVLARVTGARLILNERLLATLEALHARRERPLPRREERLALLPQGAVLWSVEGGEPGWLLETERSAVAVLPAVSPTLTDLLTRHLLPFAHERLGREGVLVRTLKTAGLTPSEVEQRISPWLGSGEDVSVSCVPVDGEVWVRLAARAASLPLAEAALRDLEGPVADALGVDCYGRDQESLEGVVGRLLRERGLTLAVAESCTGGLLGHRITNVSGSSVYFERGVVAYSNRAKEELLGVPRQLLVARGAVSAPVAEAMARGICRASNTPLGLAVTGIAGPEGGSPAKPVGTVFVALAYPGGAESRQFRFAGGRESIKWQSAQMALDLLRRWLLSGR
ncbi:MAG: nicotinamide-nucleotide amidohydrolase family protein [Candidatus Rokubacteria bacterium]|nr:nicotinamide-nucleotide amidohydrolase family protein [Candidatus Rokubacteria bacterium]